MNSKKIFKTISILTIFIEKNQHERLFSEILLLFKAIIYMKEQNMKEELELKNKEWGDNPLSYRNSFRLFALQKVATYVKPPLDST
ncbi:hypothetical protein [Heyndrickxia camelliae]|uniref:Uncharacterized protein n=1 Tax=Heyndrickxia camelliae TaxID=1707093 RepID=A0A2N3LF22_9BACI|nr:hypothetical protein [Heyndrickxia camelliae]PKR83230.1 hypothetical protein CWO92_20515 [Heyndrickxia camelliae]